MRRVVVLVVSAAVVVGLWSLPASCTADGGSGVTCQRVSFPVPAPTRYTLASRTLL
jgi:hypothetical protein